MQKERFVTGFFRFIGIAGPILMLIKSMFDKHLKSIEVEIILLTIYCLLIVFFLGFIWGCKFRGPNT